MINPRLPETITISVQASGQPLAGAWIDVRLGTTRKNPHGFLAGPTDQVGQVTVRRSEIEEHALESVETSPMDHAGLDAWDGLIHAVALNRDRVRGVMVAVDLWGHLGSLKTEENLALLREYGRSLEALADAQLSVGIVCDPSDAAVLRTSVSQA